MGLFEDLDIVIIATSAILVLLFSAVLVMNLLGSKFNFVTVVTSMLILSNLAAIASIKADTEV